MAVAGAKRATVRPAALALALALAAAAAQLLLPLLLLLARPAAARLVTLRNDAPRFDVDGVQMDCHSGNIVFHAGLYVMVGEMYRNYSGLHCGNKEGRLAMCGRTCAGR